MSSQLVSSCRLRDGAPPALPALTLYPPYLCRWNVWPPSLWRAAHCSNTATSWRPSTSECTCPSRVHACFAALAHEYVQLPCVCRVGQNHICGIHIYGVCTAFLAGKSPNIRLYTVFLYIRFWPTLRVCDCVFERES